MPPTCRPECIMSSECSLNQACVNQKCINPCPGTCGLNTKCQVINHNPICVCKESYTGDPFTRCIPFGKPRELLSLYTILNTFFVVPEVVIEQKNPCEPSPCGPYSICKVTQSQPSCTCQSSYIGSPPNCRPECISNNECPFNLACIKEKCQDPCINVCGVNAECKVISHTPICSCLTGFTGDPFIQCNLQTDVIFVDFNKPCTPSPCGANAVCREKNGAGSCSCLSNYIGNPYEGCRPECSISSDCPADKTCIKNKCENPCLGTCGINALCQVINHLPSCTCPESFTGNPFTICTVQTQSKQFLCT